MPKSGVLKFSCTVKSPRGVVFRNFTDAPELKEWFCDRAVVSAREGGAFHFEWTRGWWARGTFTKVRAPAALTFTWFGPGEPKESRVEVSFKTVKGGTSVALLHSGLGAAGKWPAARKEIEKGWTDALENLKSVIETGLDLRFTRRPMLGIGFDLVTPEKAKAAGLKTKHGVKISMLTENAAAMKAGLRPGDILLSLGGHALKGWNDLVASLQERRAGDTVEARFYRDGDLQKVKVTLGARPIPDMPASHQEAVAALRKTREELCAELDTIIAGVDEKQAEVSPAPGKWCAKEALAHLIITETLFHTGIIRSFAGETDEETDNISVYPEALGGVLAVHPDLPSLAGRLKNEMSQTVEVFARLRPEFQAHKARYRGLYLTLTYYPEHTRHHFRQFRLALEGKSLT